MNSEIFQQVFGLQREELNKQFARLELLANLHERLTGQNPLKPKDAKRKCEEETSQRKRRATNGKVLKKRISLRPTEIEVELIPLLSPPHGCLEEKSVPVFVDVMKKTSLTDDKCVVLTCIKSTKSQVVLAKFVDCDGLCVLNDWLLEWRKNLQIDMLRHMLESVAHLPVTVASLKSSNFGKSLKKLTKLQDLSKMAENLIEEYTSRITGSTQEASNMDIHDTNLKDSEEKNDVKPELFPKPSRGIKILDSAPLVKPLSSPSANNAISKNISPKSETVVEVPIETPVTTKKKKVTWKNDSQLVEIRIFARDEPEEELKEEEAKVISEEKKIETSEPVKAETNQPKNHESFINASKRERQREKQLLEKKNQESEDIEDDPSMKAMTRTLRWRRPLFILIPSAVKNANIDHYRGKKSEMRRILEIMARKSNWERVQRDSRCPSLRNLCKDIISSSYINPIPLTQTPVEVLPAPKPATYYEIEDIFKQLSNIPYISREFLNSFRNHVDYMFKTGVHPPQTVINDAIYYIQEHRNAIQAPMAVLPSARQYSRPPYGFDAHIYERPPGEEFVLPFPEDPSKHDRQGSRGNTKNRTKCTYYKTSQGCMNGVKCRFLHE